MGEIALGMYAGYELHEFEVVKELVGATFDFEVSGKRIRLELPKLVDADKLSVGLRLGDPLAGEDGALTYHINWVRFFVDLREKVSLPDQVISDPKTAHALLSNNKKASLTRKLIDEGDFTRNVYERWIRVVRWKMLDGTVGRTPQNDLRGMTQLRNLSDDRSFWVNGGISPLVYDKTITTAVWNEVREVLQLGERAPLVWDLLFASEESFERGDLNRTVVDLAMTCEVYMKKRVEDVLPELKSNVLDWIERAPINRHMDFFLEILDQATPEFASFKSIADKVRKLFSDRNEVVHAGSNDSLTDDKCLEHLRVTRSLLMLGTTGFKTYQPVSPRFSKYWPVEYYKRGLGPKS